MSVIAHHPLPLSSIRSNNNIEVETGRNHWRKVDVGDKRGKIAAPVERDGERKYVLGQERKNSL